MSSNDNFFPLVRIPDELIKAQKFSPSREEVRQYWLKRSKVMCEAYFAPAEPKRPTPPQNPSEFKMISITTTKIIPVKFYYHLLVIIALFILMIALLALGLRNWFAILVVGLVIASNIYSHLKKLDNANTKIYSNKKVKKTDSEYKAEVDEYEKKQTKYHDDLEKFPQALKFHKETMLSLSKHYFDTEKFMLISEMFEKALIPKLFPKRGTIAKKGKAEIFFLEYLIEEFGEQISCDLSVTYGTTSFYPDFIYVDRYKGFHLNIEVDEPYDYETKKPIHYKNHNSDYRDNFFLENNWIIVRFSEKQVIKYPNECVLFLKSVITDIRSNKILNTTFEHQEAVWTYEQSLIWSKNNYRESYFK